MDKTRAQYLLFEAYEREGFPAFVHGTSVAAVEILLKTGRLPPGLGSKIPGLPPAAGYLYFVPRSEAFVGHQLAPQISRNLTMARIDEDAEIYAGIQERELHLSEILGEPVPVGVDTFDLMRGLESSRELRSLGVDVKKLQQHGLRKLRRELGERKGVILGINKGLLELKLERGDPGARDEVKVYLPSGLDEKYVQYILPIGKREEVLLNDLIEERL